MSSQEAGSSEALVSSLISVGDDRADLTHRSSFGFGVMDQDDQTSSDGEPGIAIPNLRLNSGDLTCSLWAIALMKMPHTSERVLLTSPVVSKNVHSQSIVVAEGLLFLICLWASIMKTGGGKAKSLQWQFLDAQNLCCVQKRLV